jgi:hypothetical protein
MEVTLVNDPGKSQQIARTCTQHPLFEVHPICRIQGFEIVAPYTLHAGFHDGTQQIVNFLPVLGEGYTARSAT